MAFTYLMRGWDPVGEQYKHWTAPSYDSLGSHYIGPPAFGTLVGVTALDIFLEADVVGFSVWDPVFEATQDVAQFTEDSAQFSAKSDLRFVAVLEVSGQGIIEQPELGTKNHPSTSQESELRDVPTEYQSGFGISPAPLHQFEAI